MALSIRPATSADARAIAALQLRSWWRAYPDVVDPRHLEAWDTDSRAVHWATLLATHAGQTLVAEHDGVIHAFASFGGSREDDPAGEGEVFALYVEPGSQGAGLGTALLAAAVDALRAQGVTAVVLRVLAANAPARGFYEVQGWTLAPDDEQAHDWGPHVLYRRDL